MRNCLSVDCRSGSRRRALGAIAVALAAGSLIGCASTASVPTVRSGAFEPASLRVEQSGGEHVVAAELTSPGWDVTLTRTLEEFRCRGVYLTLRRPDPAVNYAQVLVTQRVASGVPEREAVRVYARVLEYGEPEGDEPYQLAAEHAGTASAAQPTAPSGR